VLLRIVGLQTQQSIAPCLGARLVSVEKGKRHCHLLPSAVENSVLVLGKSKYILVISLARAS
jgi:hypothetical protein